MKDRARRALFVALALTGSRVAQAQPPAFPPAPVQARTEDARPAVTWGAELDTSSRYIWHGIPYSTGAVVWPSAWVSTKGLTVTLWTNFDPGYLHAKKTRAGDVITVNGPTFNEYDLSAAYERSFGKLTVTGTVSRYTYREPKDRDIDPGSTAEVLLRAEYTAGPGEIFTIHSIDVEAHRGAYYVEAGYGLERELGPKSTLKVDASVAFWSKFVKNYDLGDYGSMGPATVNVALVRHLTPFISVRPHVTFMRPLNGNARRGLGTPGVSGGLALTLGY
jgi:hypothetical protein